MTNGASGMASGLATGLAVGLVMKNQAENKVRRKSNIGDDQIIIKSRKNEQDLKKGIANLFSNWYFKENKIMEKKSWFDMTTFIISLIVIGFIWFFVWLAWDMQHSYYGAFPFGWIFIIFSTIIISLIISWFFNRDSEIKYIDVEELGKERIIQIKVYDSDGYRNIDNLGIIKIENLANSQKRGKE